MSDMTPRDWWQSIAYGVGAALLGRALSILCQAHPDLGALAIGALLLATRWFTARQTLKTVRRYVAEVQSALTHPTDRRTG